MLFIIFVNVVYLQKYNSKSIDKSILDKIWYNYDYSTGFYDTLFISNNTITYNSTSDEKKYSNCKTYTYNKSSNTINMNCGKKILINKIEDNKLVVYEDSKTKSFFLSSEDALNYEFESYYSKSISEYKKEMNRVNDYLKINYSRLLELINNNEEAIVVFIGNRCTSVDCILSSNVIENMLTKYDNIYYFDSNDLNDKEMLELNTKISGFNNSIDYYNDIYPTIINISSNKIVNEYKIKCSGFNCDMYIEK